MSALLIGLSLPFFFFLSHLQLFLISSGLPFVPDNVPPIFQIDSSLLPFLSPWTAGSQLLLMSHFLSTVSFPPFLFVFQLPLGMYKIDLPSCLLALPFAMSTLLLVNPCCECLLKILVKVSEIFIPFETEDTQNLNSKELVPMRIYHLGKLSWHQLQMFMDSSPSAW